jgi:phage tail-like protein
MPSSPVTTQASEPYERFRFRVKWDGRYVAGISRVSPLVRTTEVVEEREGGSTDVHRKQPGGTDYAPIVLERGITQDEEFEKWANLVWSFGSGADAAPENFRKDIIIELYNEAGQLVLAYKVYRCWVSRYEALPELDAAARGVAIEHIRLENEGWARDLSVVPPAA